MIMADKQMNVHHSVNATAVRVSPLIIRLPHILNPFLNTSLFNVSMELNH